MIIFNKMKKSLPALVLVFLIISCKKEHKTRQTGDVQHKVAFNVGFSQQIVDFSTGTKKLNTLKTDAVTLADKIDVLFYAVYDASGNQIHVIKQLATDSGFGSYTDILNPGTYNVVVAGGKAGFSLAPDLQSGISTSKLSTDVLNYGSRIVSGGTTVWNSFNKDAFYKKIQLTVANTDLTQNFALDRIVSLLVANINDAVPSNVKTIGIILSPMPNRFQIGSGLPSTAAGGGVGVIDTLSASDIGKTNHQLSTIFLYSQPFNFTIKASSGLDFNTSLVANKTSSGITGAPNTKTNISGNLFGGAGGGSNVKIDTSWNSTPIVKSFP